MTKRGKQLHRRRFLKTTTAAASAAMMAPTIIPSSALGRDGAVAPSERVVVGGIGIGIFAGPNQAASRSIMGRFVPEKHQTEFFGFFAFSGKATAFLGPLLLGMLSGAFGQRAGVSVVILFFIVGGALLLSVDEQRGIAAAKT